jgi:hypothetical protein
MRDTLITLAGAILSFIVLVNLMSSQTDQVAVSRPTTEDAGRHGMKAFYSWLAANNLNIHSLRTPVTRIDQQTLPPSGNLMVVSLPFAREPLDSEWLALNNWIREGNAMLVLASLYNIPPWSGADEWSRENDITHAISELTAEEFMLQRDAVEDERTEFSLLDMQESIQAFKPSAYRLHPAIEHSLFSNISELESIHTPGLYQYKNESDEIQASYWTIESESSRLGLRLLYGESQQQTAMWLLPVGKGWIYLSAFPDLLGNGVVKQQDNARWFTNLMSHTIYNGGYVIFDDYHFGLSDLYDPEAFFADHRLHNSLLFIGAFWLIYALGRSPRLAPVRNRSAKPASRDFIEAMAGFFTRRIKPAAIAHELAARLLEDISAHTQLSGDALWNWLHDHPDISQQDIQSLQRANGRTPGTAKLIQLTRSINRIQKVLT